MSHVNPAMGPGSIHVEHGRAHNKRFPYNQNTRATDLPVQPGVSRGDGWAVLEPTDATMHWNGPIRSRNEIETCAPCHSASLADHPRYAPGQHFLDAYVPSLLEEGVYYADGQILEEDYEYGSFLQSKMYHKGVTCSDCHSPHSGKLPPVSMNAVCGKCHSFLEVRQRATSSSQPK